MDPRQNPYAPGAGVRPPRLAGRGDLIERAAVALDRIRAGRSARSFILCGLRGAGKTVLLNRVRLDAEARGFAGVRIECSEGRTLPGLLVPMLRAALLRLSRSDLPKGSSLKGMRVLTSFARAVKGRFHDAEFVLDADVGAEVGLADSGDLDADLSDLFTALGKEAGELGTSIVLFVDELQNLPEEHLGSLITALHGACQEQLPITMVAAGTPQLIGHAGRAKSIAEQLFEFTSVGSLDGLGARDALITPALNVGAKFSDEAIIEIIAQTGGYPYFLQEWGKHSWNAAGTSEIQLDDVHHATIEALAELDMHFFRVGFDRLTPTEKRYMRAMAELGPGPHRSSDIANIIERKVTTVAPLRSSLMNKGVIYSPARGETAFTVPLFDGFMKRTMPEL